MSNPIPHVNDRRGFLFTINRDSTPVYQVESSAWACAERRWSPDEIPQEIVAKVAQLKQSGKPGAFVQFLQGEVGVYVICEKNIKGLPELADDEPVTLPPAPAGSARQLAPYDIVICAKGGAIHGQDGETSATQEDDYYVIPCQSWGRFVLPEAQQPEFVATTKDFLLLLEDLHGKNYFAMTPDKPGEALPPDFGEPEIASFGIACYVLNLSSFKR